MNAEDCGNAANLIYLCTSDTAPPRGSTRRLPLKEWHALAKRALSSGATARVPGRLTWNLAPWCSDPYPVYVDGLPELGVTSGTGTVHMERTALGTIELDTACRRCAGCLRHRQNLWSARARAEISASARTWFGTLTVRPEQRFLVEYQARKDAGPAWAGFGEDERLLAQHNVISKEVTRYLKRVRKNSGAKLRYMLVMEQHKDGFPHYHVLCHEPDVTRGVTWRQLSHAWTWGFSQWKLVDQDPKAARYVTKYLGKSRTARVRASLAYGTS